MRVLVEWIGVRWRRVLVLGLVLFLLAGVTLMVLTRTGGSGGSGLDELWFSRPGFVEIPHNPNVTPDVKVRMRFDRESRGRPAVEQRTWKVTIEATPPITNDELEKFKEVEIERSRSWAERSDFLRALRAAPQTVVDPLDVDAWMSNRWNARRTDLGWLGIGAGFFVMLVLVCRGRTILMIMRRAREGACLKCGHLLVEENKSRCPECGAETTPATVG